MNKKAAAITALVSIILSLVGFVVVASVIGDFVSDLDEKEQEIACQNSIALRAQNAIDFKGGIVDAKLKTVPVLCNTIDIEDVKGKKDEISKVLASKIARCWWMFGEGRYESILDPSSADLAPSLFGMKDTPNECFTCYHVTIDPKVKEHELPNQGEFLQYMWNNRQTAKFRICNDEVEDCQECTKDSQCLETKSCSADPKGNKWCDKIEKVNYMDYIQGYGGPGMFVNIGGPRLQAGHSYTISILPKNTKKEQPNWALRIGLGAAAVGAVVCTVVTFGSCGAAIASVAGTTVGKIAIGSAATTFTTGAGLEIFSGEEREAPEVLDDFNIASGLSVESMFEERAVSAIYLAEAEFGQQFCGSGDLGGRKE